MQAAIAVRLLRVIPVALAVVTVIFLMFRAVPGDPASQIAGPTASRAEVEAVRAQLGLDRPVMEQYARHVWGLLHGDFGFSTIYRGNPLPVIASRLPATMALTGAAILLTVVLGIPMGVIAAAWRDRAADHALTLSAVALLAMPNFWVGMLLISLLSVELGWLPGFGFNGPASLVLPSLALAARLIALVARMTRGTVIDELRRDYVRTAWAKGLGAATILLRHVLRNAMIPTLTVIGLQAGYLLGGSVVIERLFAWPGIGDLMINAIAARDYTLVQAVTVVFVVGFLAINLIVDILTVAINPRLRLA